MEMLLIGLIALCVVAAIIWQVPVPPPIRLLLWGVFAIIAVVLLFDFLPLVHSHALR